MAIIKYDRSIIPACDVNDLESLGRLVEATSSVEGVGAYKIGFNLVIRFGMPATVETIRKFSDLPIIYDHQKGGTDIPEVGAKFVDACKSSCADAIILFPMTGPVSEKTWIDECKKQKMDVIIGGEMTHPGYKRSEGGYIADDACEEIYLNAAKEGVKDFVVPGNRIERISIYAELLKKVKPVFYSPGLVAQGGKITDSAKAAGERWHAIVGRGIYQAEDMNAAAKELTRELL
jgi:orotidine-5'-phosphate decarboxylase